MDHLTRVIIAIVTNETAVTSSQSDTVAAHNHRGTMGNGVPAAQELSPVS